ncbi:MAG TPA: STAS domain-containing protein [Gammaproteobacteria bacterium]|nr:STAS domain-containing protein [Gammaproteobacteria bacterium]
MELSPRRVGDVIVLRPAGRIDHLNADDFRSSIEPQLAACTGAGPALLFDLSGLEYISSAGLRVLMVAAKTAKPRGGRIAVAAPQPLVAEVLDISRFNLVFPVHASLDEGLRALRAA